MSLGFLLGACCDSSSISLAEGEPISSTGPRNGAAAVVPGDKIGVTVGAKELEYVVASATLDERQMAAGGASAMSIPPDLRDWASMGEEERSKCAERVQSMLHRFIGEYLRGKVVMKLGRNGRLFYRLVVLEKDLRSIAVHIKGSIVEYPIASIEHIAFGYDLTEFTHVPIQLPSDTLACVVVMRASSSSGQGQQQLPSVGPLRMNLVFPSTQERDLFVTCMLVLRERVLPGALNPQSKGA